MAMKRTCVRNILSSGNAGKNAWMNGGQGALGLTIERPYYLKQSGGNPLFAMEHDGTSTKYMSGFTAKKMDFLTRFRWNTKEWGACPMYLRHPSQHKYVHWMEVSRARKFWQEVHSEEPYNMIIICYIVIAFTIWHCYRYTLYHNQHSLYGLTAMPAKQSITMRRHEAYHPMDKPAFRFYQVTPEVYWSEPRRDQMVMGIVANDPFVAHCDEVGQRKNAEAHAEEKNYSYYSAESPVGSLTAHWHHKWDEWKNVGKH